MWKLKTVAIVPIVLSTTGIIPKQLHQSLETLSLAPYMYEILQKAVILNTCRIVRNFLQLTTDTEQIKTQTITTSTQASSSSPS
jgi:hypothetical protein